MKTMLHLSIALMMVAGGAGAIDFTKMYRSGEIDKIYNEDGQSPIAHVTPPVTKPLNPPVVVAAINKLTPTEPLTVSYKKKNLPPPVVEPEVTAPLQEQPLANNFADAELGGKAIESTDAQHDEAPLKDEVVKPKKKRMKLSMYSRAYIPELEEEEALTDTLSILEN